MTEDESKTAAADLAKRLRLLLDVVITESGVEPTYSQIAAYLGERGTNLSRSRWTYMVNAQSRARGHCAYIQRTGEEVIAPEFFDRIEVVLALPCTSKPR